VPVAVLPEIVEWSRERPLWQQDALRRLVEQPKLNPSDFTALAALCKAEAGLDVGEIEPARGIGDRAAIAGGAGAPVVRLAKVHSIKNVNALRDDQTLSVASSGLTVVYGDNGAGKTGYVRVLKQVCRARGARDAVHPNVYTDPSGPASAAVCYELIESGGPGSVESASVEAEAVIDASASTSREVVWGPGVRAPDELAQVSVFDSRSASVYVTEENAVAYLPHGTDLFPRLVSVVETVRSLLEQEVSEVERSRDRFETVLTGTAVHDVLANLHVTNARERIDKLAGVTDADRVRLDDLRTEERRLQADDPASKAKELRRCATRLEEARGRLATLKKALDASGIAELREAREALDSARAAAELASGRAFADAPIGGVGTDAWRELWRAARKFAEQGMVPSRPFPVGPLDDPRCVLCQQTLDEAASTRMHRFEEFVRGETRAQVDRAIKELQARIRALEALAPGSIADKVLLEEIAGLDTELVGLLNDCTAKLVSRRNEAVAAAKAPVAPSDWQGFIHEPTGALARLEQLAKRLGDEATQYETSADPDALKRATDAIREIEARIVLDGLRDRAEAEVARQERKAALKRALGTTNTTGITRRNTELLKEAVTEPLTLAFAEHIRALALTHLPVGVTASGGEKGRAFHALALEKKGSSRVPTEEVLSEGEHRGVALAAFLAEISLQDSASTVVFDDPVSSMDHGRREFVARRIVEIAKTRPVLVFTHDFVFLLLLQRTADNRSVPVQPRYFRRDGTRAGLVVEDWPWDGQSVKTRLGSLKQTSQGFPKLATEDRPRYEKEVRDFYDALRTTWERAVEEVLFNDAIRRFGKEVQTQRLKNLHRLTQQHLIDLDAGMTRASDWVQGHDHAPDLALPVPEPHEAAADLDALDGWVRDVRKQLQN
jgi:energy-coupling factor transporter ATP-binding protein EcfA2